MKQLNFDAVIPPRRKLCRKVIEWSEQPLGKEDDAVIAARLGVKSSLVRSARLGRRIPSVRPRGKKVGVDWKSVDFDRDPEELAISLGVSTVTVLAQRERYTSARFRRFRIASVSPDVAAECECGGVIEVPAVGCCLRCAAMDGVELSVGAYAILTELRKAGRSSPTSLAHDTSTSLRNVERAMEELLLLGYVTRTQAWSGDGDGRQHALEWLYKLSEV